MSGNLINVHLGTTLCVDSENRSFIRVDVECQNIDVDGDVEAQAQTDLKAAVKVFKVLDDGLQEMVSDIILGAMQPGLVRDQLAEQSNQIARLTKLMPGVINRVKEIDDRTKAVME